MADTQATMYERSFTSFAGPDIVPIFNNKIIGECQAITYSIRREKAQHSNVAARRTNKFRKTGAF